MKKLTGVKIDKLDFIPVKQGDLLYHEGPLLSVFKDLLSDSQYFYKWSDCDENAHRWLIFKVSIANLKDFFEGKCSLKNLISVQPFVYALDLDNDLEPKNIVILATKNIPKSYFPEADSYFDKANFEDYALILKQKINEKVLVLA